MALGTMSSRWDQRFLRLAAHVASWSKDPSTQCGAVITDEKNRIVSIGFNGFPRGLRDDERLHNREEKYRLVLHAETNALMDARGRAEGCTCYVYPMPPCSNCATQLIQAGIVRVVSMTPTERQLARWGDSFSVSRAALEEAGVYLILLDAHPEPI